MIEALTLAALVAAATPESLWYSSSQGRAQWSLDGDGAVA